MIRAPFALVDCYVSDARALSCCIIAAFPRFCLPHQWFALSLSFFSFLVYFFYYRYASNLCQSNTCPLWQVFDWLYDSDSNQTLAPFGKCIESLWKFLGIYFLMVELFLPVLSPILHIGKEIFLHHNQEQIATRYDGFDVPLGDTVVIRMVFHFVWQQLQENFSLSMVKMAITYFLKCSGRTYHVSDALC